MTHTDRFWNISSSFLGTILSALLIWGIIYTFFIGQIKQEVEATTLDKVDKKYVTKEKVDAMDSRLSKIEGGVTRLEDYLIWKKPVNRNDSRSEK